MNSYSSDHVETMVFLHHFYDENGPFYGPNGIGDRGLLVRRNSRRANLCAALFSNIYLQRLIRPYKIDSGVIVPDYSVVFDAHFGEAKGAVLAHADAVAPASAGEGVARYR